MLLRMYLGQLYTSVMQGSKKIYPGYAWSSHKMRCFSSVIKAFRAFSARKFFVFPLMTDAVFTQRCGLEGAVKIYAQKCLQAPAE